MKVKNIGMLTKFFTFLSFFGLFLFSLPKDTTATHAILTRVSESVTQISFRITTTALIGAFAEIRQGSGCTGAVIANPVLSGSDPTFRTFTWSGFSTGFAYSAIVRTPGFGEGSSNCLNGTTPLTPPPVPVPEPPPSPEQCARYDFDGDLRITTQDFSLLLSMVGNPNADPKFDLNGDGAVSSLDVFAFNHECIGVEIPPPPEPEPTPAVGINPCKDTDGDGTIDTCPTALGNIPINPTDFAGKVLSIGTGLAGGLALILMVIGAIRVLTSQGDQQRLAGGREMIIAAIAGLLFVILAVSILRLLGFQIFGFTFLRLG